MPIQSKSPYSGKIHNTYNEHTDHEVDEAIGRAHSAYLAWKLTTFEERSRLMKAAAEEIRQNKAHYAGLMTAEMGKHKREAEAEMDKCALACDYYADNAEKFLADEKLPVEEGEAYIAYDPMGVVLAIMPWNFPYWQVIRFAAPALMAGNVGILKHSSVVPGCALALEEIFRKAGFPEGCFTTLLVSGSKVSRILENPKVKAATLTGSEGAGSKVAEKSGAELKKTVLELGGSDPFIVLEDADVEETATTAVKARMQNCGQSCIAAKRFFVHEKIYDEWLEKFRSGMERLTLGDPEDQAIDYGPMATEDLANELLEQVKKSVDKGAKVLLGGDRPDREGAFFNPTILTDVKPGMPAYDEELFGPVAMVFKVKDEEEAVLIANDSPYGLGGSVWTGDIERGKRLVRKVESGAVYINKMMASAPEVPFGGVKKSGYGRELSHLGIREFVNQKTVWIS
ncbi:NAD-dependent succinate-semialdehyde dehydrogenase [Roseivirga sp. BDSF3-8]|uniref:NAD-dependent succinate-semialdehyde dehydrogenase n=1 Tax=Roseivirga sp. BDSF3-8 TaxID=3241598 RepID=UPI003532039B